MRSTDKCWTSAVALAVVLAAAVLSHAAEPPGCPERVGHWGDGAPQVVRYVDDSLLVGSGRVLGVVDDTAPLDRRPFRSEIQFAGGVLDVAVVGNLAYVTAGAAGINVIDLTGLPDLSLVYQIPTPGWATGVAVDGDIAYVTFEVGYYQGGLLVVDVSTPTQPAAMSRLDIGGDAGGVAIHGDHALVVARHITPWGFPVYHLHVIDVSDPTAPFEVGIYSSRLTTSSWVWPVGVEVLGHYALLPHPGGSLLVIDVSEPDAPHVVARIECPHGGGQIALQGHLAGVTGHSGVSVVDLSNPLDPVELGAWSNGWHPHLGMTLNRDRMAVVALDHDLHLDLLFELDLNDLPDLEPHVTRTWPGYPRAHIALAGTTVVLTDGPGLTVLDLSRTGRPKRVSTFPTRGAARRVAVTGDRAVVSTDDGWLHLVDVSDPARPIEIWSRAIGVQAHDIDASGDLAVLSDVAGLHLFELAPVSGSSDAMFLPLNGAHRVALSSPLAAAVKGSWLKVISVSDPRLPQVVSTYFCHAADDVSVRADVVLVSTRVDALHVIGVSDPAVPVELAVHRLPTQGNSSRLATTWPLTTMCAGNRCMVFDLTHPTLPRQIGLYAMPAGFMDVAASGTRVVLSEFGVSVDAGWPEALTVLSTAACLGREDRRDPR